MIVRLPEFVKVLFFSLSIICCPFCCFCTRIMSQSFKVLRLNRELFFHLDENRMMTKITNNKWNLDQNIFYCVPLTLNWHELNMHCWSEMVINKKKQKTVQTMIWSDRSENNGSAPVSGPICIYDSVHCSLQEFPLIYYQSQGSISVYLPTDTQKWLKLWKNTKE